MQGDGQVARAVALLRVGADEEDKGGRGVAVRGPVAAKCARRRTQRAAAARNASEKPAIVAVTLPRLGLIARAGSAWSGRRSRNLLDAAAEAGSDQAQAVVRGNCYKALWQRLETEGGRSGSIVKACAA